MEIQQITNCAGRRGATLLRAVRVLVFSILVSNLPFSVPAFARQPGLDCLVQIEVDDTGSLPFVEFRRSWIDFLLGRNLLGIDKLGGINYGWENQHRMYVLVSDDCARKLEKIRSLINEFLIETGYSKIEMTVGEAVNLSDRIKRAFTLPPPPKYGRRDCIVEIDVLAGFGSNHWNAPGDERPTRFFLKYAKSHHPRFPFFSFSGNGDQVYIQFYDHCDRRVILAKELMSAYMALYPTGPKFIVREKTVDPGPKTIDSTGPGWTDTRPLTHPRNVP